MIKSVLIIGVAFLATLLFQTAGAQSSSKGTTTQAKQSEQGHMTVNTQTGAAVITPGKDLVNSTMPAGNRTSHNFPENPPANESNTTVHMQSGTDD